MITLTLQPLDKNAFVHGPTKTRDCNFNCHNFSRLNNYSLVNSNTALTILFTFGIIASSNVGLYGVGVNTPHKRLIGASNSSNATSETRAAISELKPY